MTYADLNGCSTYYEVSGSGLPLLFLHGGFGGLGTGGVQSLAPPWLQRFAATNTVVTFDRRSSGRSGAPETTHTLHQFAEDAFALLGHLGFDRAAIWGNSAGVAPAITFALEHPDATAALVLSDGAPWFSHDAELVDKLRARLELLHREGPEAAYAARAASGTVGLDLFAASRAVQDPKHRDESRESIRTALAAVPREVRIEKYASELRTYEAYVDFDVTDRLPELQIPVLVVYGTADTIFPAVPWPALLAPLPNYEYLPVEGADHGVAMRDEVQAAVHAFLRRVGGAPA